MGSIDFEKLILEEIANSGHLNTYEFAKDLQQDHQLIVGAIKSIQSVGEIINTEQCQQENLVLTEEGVLIADKGSHEALLYNDIPSEGIKQADIKNLGPNASIGFSKAMSSGWLRIDKSAEGGPRVYKKVESIEDSVQQSLIKILNNEYKEMADAKIKELKKRKLVATQIIKSFTVTKGKDFSLSVKRLEADLTADLLLSGLWEELTFKPYNFDALGASLPSGHLHPLMKVRSQFRQIFLEMGFTEMPTNNFVESSFWNFDTLFQPQQHPARDAHDTFFLSDPAVSKLEEMPQSYIEAVKRTHEHGGYGSQGYQYD
ncbi:phenylalanine--tRNA ligase alpha subunit-like, partial [Exaiptasia diaphana]